MIENIRCTLQYINQFLSFETNDNILYNNLKNEYIDYISFKENYSCKNQYIKVRILQSKNIYDKYAKKLINNRPIFNNIYIALRRDNVIIIDRIKKEISIIYEKYSDEKLQHVEEIILGIFGGLLEEDGFFFIHAACVAKKGKGIVILDNRQFEKTSLMLMFLQNSFDFITNSQLAILGNIGVSIPTRIGIKFELFYNRVIKEKYLKKIKKIIVSQKRLGIIKAKDEKFNLSVKELKEIFDTKTISKILIDFVIVPCYLPGLKEIEVKDMSKEEIIDQILKSRRSGVYSSVSYVEQLFHESKKDNIRDILSKIDLKGYKIFQSQLNEKQLIDYINKKICNN